MHRAARDCRASCGRFRRGVRVPAPATPPRRQTPSGSRLVISVRRSGHLVNRATATSAAASITCSALSSTNNVGLSRRRRSSSATTSRRGTTPISMAICSATSPPTASTPRSIHHASVLARSGVVDATRSARRDLPLPPAPVSVTIRWSPSSAVTSATSRLRPMNELSGIGRRRCESRSATCGGLRCRVHARWPCCLSMPRSDPVCDRAVEFDQRRRRLGTDVVAQHRPIRLVLAQRLGRSPGMVQRPHQQRPGSISIGMLVDQRDELDHRRSILARVEQNDDQFFHRRGVQLTEPSYFHFCPRLIGKLVVRQTTPHRTSPLEVASSLLGTRDVSGSDQLLVLADVDVRPKLVTGRTSHEALRPDHPSQPTDRRPKGTRRQPEVLLEHHRTHHRVRTETQQREETPLRSAGERQLLPLGTEHTNRAEHLAVDHCPPADSSHETVTRRECGE
jgi:hypothetical protein